MYIILAQLTIEVASSVRLHKLDALFGTRLTHLLPDH